MYLLAHLYKDFEDVISVQAMHHPSLGARSNGTRAKLEKNMTAHQEMKQLCAEWTLAAV